MRDIKFEYVFKHVDTGRIIREQYDIVRIEVVARDDIHYHADRGYRLVSRRQFTGLHDKSGVEIYEGDLIVDRDRDQPAIVEYREDNCCFALSSNSLVTKECVNRFQYEVIGNTYENPELLND